MGTLKPTGIHPQSRLSGHPVLKPIHASRLSVFVPSHCRTHSNIPTRSIRLPQSHRATDEHGVSIMHSLSNSFCQRVGIAQWMCFSCDICRASHCTNRKCKVALHGMKLPDILIRSNSQNASGPLDAQNLVWKHNPAAII